MWSKFVSISSPMLFMSVHGIQVHLNLLTFVTGYIIIIIRTVRSYRLLSALLHWFKLGLGLLGPFAWTCNPSKWEAGIWGGFEVRRSAILHYTVNQHQHWAHWQYDHSGGTCEWLGVKRCQLSLQDTSCNAKQYRRAAVGHWVSLCVKCCRMVDSVPRWWLFPTNWSDHLSIPDYDDTAFGAGKLPCTFLESRSMTVENLFIILLVYRRLDRATCTVHCTLNFCQEKPGKNQIYQSWSTAKVLLSNIWYIYCDLCRGYSLQSWFQKWPFLEDKWAKLRTASEPLG